jgi:membrane-associated phospholipid phosphatase
VTPRSAPLRRGAWWRTAGALVICAAALLAVMTCLGELDIHILWHGPVGAEDRMLDSTLARDRTGLLDRITAACTACAATMPVIAAGIVVVVAAWLAFRRWREPLFVAAALLGEVGIFVATTLLVHRPRPAVAHLDAAPPTSSFPSGHTAAATVLYGGVAVLVMTYGARRWWRRIAVTLAILMPVLVAASRLYRGMHYLTDVIAGAVLGGAWLLCAAAVLLRRAPARGTVATSEAPLWSAAGARPVA